MEPSLCNDRRDIRRLPQAFTSKPTASFPPWDAWESLILPWVHPCWESIFVSPLIGGQFTVSNRCKWFVSSGRRPSYVSIQTLWTCVLCLLRTLDLSLLTTGFPSPRSVPPVDPQEGPPRDRRLRSREDEGTAGCNGSKPRLWRKTIQEEIPESLWVLSKGLHLCEPPLPHLENRDMTICLTCGSFIPSVNICWRKRQT